MAVAIEGDIRRWWSIGNSIHVRISSVFANGSCLTRVIKEFLFSSPIAKGKFLRETLL